MGGVFVMNNKLSDKYPIKKGQRQEMSINVLFEHTAECKTQ